MGFSRGDLVLYKGHNRPGLKDYQGRVNKVGFNNSCLVDFYDENNKLIQSEWVGNGALTLGRLNLLSLVADPDPLLTEMKKQLAEIEAEFEPAKKTYTDLLNRRDKLRRTLNAYTNTSIFR